MLSRKSGTRKSAWFSNTRYSHVHNVNVKKDFFPLNANSTIQIAIDPGKKAETSTRPSYQKPPQPQPTTADGEAAGTNSTSDDGGQDHSGERGIISGGGGSAIFVDVYGIFQCLSLTFHRLSLTFRCLSLPFRCLSLVSPGHPMSTNQPGGSVELLC